jgi:hypothetical protein
MLGIWCDGMPWTSALYVCVHVRAYTNTHTHTHSYVYISYLKYPKSIWMTLSKTKHEIRLNNFVLEKNMNSFLD